MKQLTCEMCDSTDLIKQGGVFVCQNCGTKYSIEEAKKMMVEGPVEVIETVKINNTDLSSNYLMMAENAYNSNNIKEAENYCNKVIEIDPDNYEAWLLKGKSAGWQSSLQNSRFYESVSAFAKAIEKAPKKKRDDIIANVKYEIKSLLTAIISLRADRFVKYPDKEETEGFMSDVASILNSMLQFISKSGVMVTRSELMAPIALKIDQSVVQTWNNIILPDYNGDDKYPNRDKFNKYIERIDYCISLLEQAITFCEDDDEKDIKRYENLIFLQNKAIEALGWNYEPYELYSSATARNYYHRKLAETGAIVDASNNKIWYKDCSLTDNAKSIRSTMISDYQNKISEIKSVKTAKEKEASDKRYNEYWEAHAEEKTSLETEQMSIVEQIASLNNKIEELKANKEKVNLQDRMNRLINERDALGMFKGKEKKVLQEQIDKSNNDLKILSSKIDSAINDIEKKIEPLQNQLDIIVDELTKPR